MKELILYRDLKYQKLFDQMLRQLTLIQEKNTETMPESCACAVSLSSWQHLMALRGISGIVF